MGLADSVINGDINLTTDGREYLTKTIFVEIDDIIADHGESYVYADIVNRKNGFGSLSKIYTTIVHRLIADMYNNAVASNDDVRQNLKDMVDWKRNKDVGNYIFDSIDNMVADAYNASRSHIKVGSRLVADFCRCFAVHMLQLIRNTTLDALDDIRYDNNIDEENGFLLLRHEVTSSLIPANNPSLLSITLSFEWINM